MCYFSGRVFMLKALVCMHQFHTIGSMPREQCLKYYSNGYRTSMYELLQDFDPDGVLNSLCNRFDVIENVLYSA